MKKKNQSSGPSLFELGENAYGAPNFHTNDPETSVAAARLHEESGKRKKHAEIVLALVRKHPGMTAVELYELATPAEKIELVEMQECRRRLTDLLTANRVKQGPAKECSIRGSGMVTWEEVTA